MIKEGSKVTQKRIRQSESNAGFLQLFESPIEGNYGGQSSRGWLFKPNSNKCKQHSDSIKISQHWNQCFWHHIHGTQCIDNNNFQNLSDICKQRSNGIEIFQRLKDSCNKDRALQKPCKGPFIIKLNSCLFTNSHQQASQWSMQSHKEPNTQFLSITTMNLLVWKKKNAKNITSFTIPITNSATLSRTHRDSVQEVAYSAESIQRIE